MASGLYGLWRVLEMMEYNNELTINNNINALSDKVSRGC